MLPLTLDNTCDDAGDGPRPAFDPGTQGLLGIVDKDREPLSIVNPGLRGIIRVEAVVQTLDVCRRGMCFDGQRTDLQCCPSSRLCPLPVACTMLLYPLRSIHC